MNFPLYRSFLNLLVFMLFLSAALPSMATEYYVEQGNPNANDQNPGTITLPWKTITKANQTLRAGDTVYIKIGSYSTFISPNNSGTAINPITYKNHGTDIVTIADTTYGIFLNGKSYINVNGINFKNLDQFLWLQNGANHNTISYSNFDQSRVIGWSGSKIYQSSSYNWVHHNRFSKYGACRNGSDDGSVLDIGNEESQTDLSKYNLIENNMMYHGGHHVLGVFGMYNVIRNNYIHNEVWTNGKGNRNLYLSGYPANSGWNLIEGNQIAYSAPPCDSWGASGMSLTTGYNIVRGNKFYYNDLSAISMTLTNTYYSDIIYNKIYNNTFLHNGWNPNRPDPLTSAIGMAIYSGSHIVKFNTIKNNLFSDHYQVYGYSNVNSSDQIFAGNWNGDAQGDPQFQNASKSPGDPMDSTHPDLHLKATSPAKDTGVYLTKITSSTGSGTSFQLEDSKYFIDGWGIVEGDTIQLQGTSEKAQITKIDYLTNTVSVDRSMTWTQNQGISLAYYGAGPDIGAYEFFDVSSLEAPSNVRFISIP